MDSRAVGAMALAALLVAVYEGTHGFADQWCQGDGDARDKRRFGDQQVYLSDGALVADTPARPGARTCTETQRGWFAAIRHAFSYEAVQVAATLAATRTCGYRVPVPALLAGAVINATTHAVIDRGPVFQWLAAKFNKAEYLERATVVRTPDGPACPNGPGTAWIELDAALHEVIGVGSALVRTAIALRFGRCR
ncbi:hypothetical protein BC739_009400 [Kutzneria viridogrisea]|uniref:Uncharacterized protein n=1 Tax=Kutzneria viridogrisea TaxID=47990 RepID=A0ABR6BYZ4_9PSEU|nr:hypothetical protein [Kutzneria viridogrisea]